MKIQTVKSQVSFERKSIVQPHVLDTLNNSRLESQTAKKLLGYVQKTLNGVEGDGFYLFDGAKISRDRKRLTLIGKFATNTSVDNVLFTIRTKDPKKEIQKSVLKYIKNFKATPIEN